MLVLCVSYLTVGFLQLLLHLSYITSNIFFFKGDIACSNTTRTHLRIGYLFNRNLHFYKNTQVHCTFILMQICTALHS